MNGSVRTNEIDATPRASSLIESLRSFGYSPATAIADLIDNSISAHARNIDVEFTWAGPASSMILTDDGDGMTVFELNEALRPGSSNPLDHRAEDDLGRFGLGLKTASFSQARVLTVVSLHAESEQAASRCWDLDHVQRTDRWVVLTDTPHGVDLGQRLRGRPGTVVGWNDLDRIVDDRPISDTRARNSFYAMVDDVRLHLETVFHRFISEGLRLSVNGTVCEPWDPFLEDHSATERLQAEVLTLTTSAGEEHEIRVQPFVLPHNSKLDPSVHKRAGGQKGWNLQQGFYLYRRGRLIVAGDWFDRGTKPEEHHKLARVRVEFDQELDSVWALDVRKAKARPPAGLRADFVRIARATRNRGEEVYRSRGRRAVGPAPRRGHRVALWTTDTSGSAVRYLVNREHPVVASLLDSHPEREVVDEALSLIESTLPVAHILSQGFRDENRIEETVEMDEGIRTAAARLFCAIISTGETVESARRIVRESQPFDVADSFIEQLDVGSCE
ncbi:MAG: ATP-binding protein [Acidimicrobiaceae bacterium]|nr:ATP-binding protein [Acidimicrobiaceae bacterium]